MNEFNRPDQEHTKWKAPKTKDEQNNVTKAAAEYLGELRKDPELGQTLKEMDQAEYRGEKPKTTGWKKAA